ncbi:HAD-IIIC family phosphatase [Streptomyces botrytidirepellens]|uniref:HAD-IIIC family phosphatase n=1 Tax=Streptomyces botrytidirepellens TaxID=2486417 RepID=A0A3M8VL09_9ACTN|nr:HAD-IIIC family phosphatase [Streptomyces botrytidirepellens]RNG18240.1 HAD-IIIC family phosphatase [Streptomyces botrytidirepellens]
MTTPTTAATTGPAPTIKCLVWDLDGTLWQGTLLEGDAPQPDAAALTTLHTLDERGILHAVASRSDHALATAHLAALGLDDLFTVVEIGWGAKSRAVQRIAETLNIGIDALAFIDNDAVERAEVASAHPAVRCYRAEQVAELPDLPAFQPPFVTDESRVRRHLYGAELSRKKAQESFEGPAGEFLATLGLTLTIRPADEDDLQRAHELTVRTHQLNTTGQTYDMDELRTLISSPHHQVLVTSLEDRYGSYGTIGLAVSELTAETSTLQLLLLSCRVMSRGVGPALIGHLVREALAAGRRPVAEFVPTDVNRVMLINLRFAGFEVISRSGGGRILLGFDPSAEPHPADGAVRIVTPPAQPVPAPSPL